MKTNNFTLNIRNSFISCHRIPDDLVTKVFREVLYDSVDIVVIASEAVICKNLFQKSIMIHFVRDYSLNPIVFDFFEFNQHAKQKRTSLLAGSHAQPIPIHKIQV